MDTARETSKERGDGPENVKNVILGSYSEIITLWGRELDFVGGDFLEAGGISRGVPQKDDGVEGKSAEGQDIKNRGSSEGAQGSGNQDTRGVHGQAAGNDGEVGGVDNDNGDLRQGDRL